MQTVAAAGASQLEAQPSRAIPEYLLRNYWWAYVHPSAVRLFERQWLVNMILCGNFVLLRDTVLDELGAANCGRTLQVACVYGDFSVRLAERIGPGGSLDVVDVLPIQLENLRRKLSSCAPVTLYQRDSTALGFADAVYDQVVIFFLLHEQPPLVRKQTIAEALRVVKPGGKVVIVDYHRPAWLHPLRYLMWPLLRTLEPYALDLWNHDIGEWLPNVTRPTQVRETDVLRRPVSEADDDRVSRLGFLGTTAGTYHSDACLRGEWVLELIRIKALFARPA